LSGLGGGGFCLLKGGGGGGKKKTNPKNQPPQPHPLPPPPAPKFLGFLGGGDLSVLNICNEQEKRIPPVLGPPLFSPPLARSNKAKKQNPTFLAQGWGRVFGGCTLRGRVFGWFRPGGFSVFAQPTPDFFFFLGVLGTPPGGFKKRLKPKKNTPTNHPPRGLGFSFFWGWGPNRGGFVEKFSLLSGGLFFVTRTPPQQNLWVQKKTKEK